jgi:hypothetical protein
MALYKYADKHRLTTYHHCDSAVPSLLTADCSAIIALYSNYIVEDNKLIEEDEEDMIQMVREALRYDKSVWQKWYFEMDDTWQPGNDD